MTVAHIAFRYGLCNTGGAAIAATRLHQALLSRGIDSHYICIHQHESGVNVHVLPQGWRRVLFLILTKMTRCVWKFTLYRRSICLNLIPLFGLEKTLAKIKPDVVHVQWINNDVCSFAQLARLPYKMVFNLHDLYLVLPMGAHPDGDCRYMEGLDRENSSWLERSFYRRKGRLVQKKASAFIGPSEWACKIAGQSLIGKGIPSYAIPNIISGQFFGELPARKRNKKLVVLFGAYGGRRNGSKGFSDLESALAPLSEEQKGKCELRIFGEEAEPCETAGVKTTFLGNVTDADSLRAIYCSADVFAFPSRQETQGMTKVEAMLCGVPVIAFDRTACAEGIELGLSGWIVHDVKGFAEALIDAIQKFSTGELDVNRQRVAGSARRRFDCGIICGRVVKVYEAT